MIRVFFFFLISASVSLASINKKVFLEVELEDVVGATSYEIEYKLQSSKSEKQKETAPISRRQSETVFKLQVESGNYSVRTRSISQDNQSEWSEWFVLTALPDAPVISKPTQSQYFTSKKIQKADVSLTWNKPNGAEKYQIVIQNLDTQATETVNTRKNSSDLRLGKGRFRVGIQSISKNNIKSEIVYYPEPFLITDRKLDPIGSSLVNDQAITWKNKAHKKINIDVYIKRFFSNEFVFLTTYTADSVPWQIPQDLKPGEYQFKLQALSDEFENSDIEVQNLLIKPQQKDFKPQF